MTNQSLYRTAKMPHRKWQQFSLPQVLNFKHNFHIEIYKFPKKKHEEMLEDGGKFFLIAILLP